jgi:glycosyltransferase involved in cell wall biosynthesis
LDYLVISVVILTQDEVVNIERCLASVSWSDDVILVDSGSTDGTVDIAVGAGARVLNRPFDNFANQRNFALDEGQLKYDWVLHLDADEEVSAELRLEIESIAEGSKGKAGYLVPSKLMLLGKWLKHSGMYPAYQVRFGRLEALRFKMVGHGQRECLESNDLGVLQGALIHHNFSKGISEWITKHARYARDEAYTSLANRHEFNWRDLSQISDSLKRRRSLKQFADSLPLRPLARFSYVYFLRLGFLDGRSGLRYALLMAVYQWMIDLNRVEMRRIQRESSR